MKITYVGLGSNLNNPCLQLQTALNSLAELEQSQLMKVSRFYQSKPWGPIQDQPPFVNAVAELSTDLDPLNLLQQLKQIEQQQGRELGERYGPRSIDLDILLYGEEAFERDSLIIPHPKLGERDFVIYPLLEIAPHLVLPNGLSLSLLQAHCTNQLGPVELL